MVKELIRKHQDLEIYKMAFDTAMQIFELSKKFPVEERYSLTDPSAWCSRSLRLAPLTWGKPRQMLLLGKPQDRAASPNSSFIPFCMCEFS
ncbi:MAG: four helix bundle protein [Scytonema sp. RU_4_4]|nr:four helix bundle protein [Scytonema sp. RU_4_4]